MEKSKLFFGYSSKPELTCETMRHAANLINGTGLADATTWEGLRISGSVIINRIFEAIDESDLSVFDVSTLNENVLFELGYAIGRGKRVWPLLETTDREARSRWDQFQLLSAVGYTGWDNAESIRAAFLSESPHRAEQTLYDELIEPNLTPQVEGALFYVPAFHNTDASKRLAQRLSDESRRGIRVLTADPTESALNPFSWYAQKVYETAGTVVHFLARRRELAWLHNARASLTAGLAAGLERPILLLAEEEYTSPLDYRDILKSYTSASQAKAYLDAWLKALTLEPQTDKGGRRLQLVTELRGLRFGEHVAENEADVLADYFVETAAFDEVLASRATLFVGRKGAGKTANMLQAAARLREDTRNLVVVIKPQSYELEGLVTLLSRLPRDGKTYLVRSLWSFLLQSEIARAAVETVEARPIAVPMTEAERKLVTFVNEAQFGLRDEFSVRFERTVRALEEANLGEVPGLNKRRDLLNEALHAEAIKRLRQLIGPVLKSRNRVALLIDNLDKAWDRHSDLEAASQLLLGLLGAIGAVAVEYDKEDFWRNRVSLSLATFLRSDIHGHIVREAREPDKIPTTVLAWESRDQLLRVVEERFLASRPAGTDPDELWKKFFTNEVHGQPLKDYLAWRVLPRPRDIVYLCNAATISAINARHTTISEKDFLAAERQYSQFAFEALLVENGITITQFEEVLFEFVGGACVMTEPEALEAIQRVVARPESEGVLTRLRHVSFLGVEESRDTFVYPEVGPLSRRAEALARKVAEGRGGPPRYQIHPAYRPFLGISDD